MIETTATIRNKKGLHARPSTQVVETAKKFEADVMIIHESIEAHANRLLDLLSMGAECGVVLKLKADGSDAEAALAAIKEVVEREFDFV